MLLFPESEDIFFHLKLKCSVWKHVTGVLILTESATVAIHLNIIT